MIYEEFDPAPAMRPWIANLWRFEVEPSDPEQFEHVIVPDGTLSISVMRSPSGARGPLVFAGPSMKAHRVPVQRGFTYDGVRLHPAATGRLLGLDAGKFRDRIGLLSAIAPDAASDMDFCLPSMPDVPSNSSIFERAVEALSSRAVLPDPAITAVVNRLLESHGAEAVSRLAAQSGLSARQLRRTFVAHVGLLPKEFARLRRIRHACILMLSEEAVALAGLSHEGGYADQPHLTREFRGVFGSSPRLTEAYLRQIKHFNVRD
jgi:AraC-like DNA-binding protein